MEIWSVVLSHDPEERPELGLEIVQKIVGTSRMDLGAVWRVAVEEVIR